MAFSPKNLQYDKNGVPVLSHSQIEHVTVEMMQKYCPERVQFPGMTPVADILDKLKQRKGLKVVFDDLGSEGPKKVLGFVHFKTKTMFFDHSLYNENQVSFRFTVAHELGHWVLHQHRPISVADEKCNNESIQSFKGKKELKTARDWTEYQANSFASCLILPRRPLQQAIVQMQNNLGITRNLGILYLNDTDVGRLEISKQFEILKEIFQVSKTALRYRLRLLGWLIEPKSSWKKMIEV
jgi:Zn-dependent peptidase ImmA (M78 family)